MHDLSVSDDHLCPACSKYFQTMQGRNAHLSLSRKCAWYRKGKLMDMYELDEEEESSFPEGTYEGDEDVDVEGDDRFDDDFYAPALDDVEEVYHMIPIPDPQVDIGTPGPGPSSSAYCSSASPSHSTSITIDSDGERITEEHPTAGKVIRMDVNLHAQWNRQWGNRDSEGNIPMGSPGDEGNHFAPFASELDWRIASWAVKDGIGHKSFDRLLSIPGVKEKLGLSYGNIWGLHKIIDEDIPARAGKWKVAKLSFKDSPNEKHTIQYRNPINAIKSLFADPSHAKDLVYKPKKLFANMEQKKAENRIYMDMWTGKWWHAVQTHIPEGATLAPVIIATDKTHLTQFSGNKTAYPVYLTIGNLPKEIRRKPSEQGCVLIGYLSVDKVSKTPQNENGMSQVEQRSHAQRLFHDSMKIVLKPLKTAGMEGVDMQCGDGSWRSVHPILACYVADYPEQCLVSCTKQGTCPKCLRRAEDLQEATPEDPRTPERTLHIISEAAKDATSASNFQERCYESDVSGGIQSPFWEGYPLTNIHSSLTPDVLHQLYQGVLRHLIEWCQQAMTKEELDRRIRCLPPAYGVRHFKNGIDCLSQISGSERKDMARILLGCLPGKIPARGIRACKAILDFIYLARYPSHDEITLGYMEDALARWQKDSKFFIIVGIREDFNIPKFHSLLHYITSIRYFGTTDNYNSELFERLHIDFAKDGWNASNHRNALFQMVKYVERQEKVDAFQSYIKMRTRAPTPTGPCLTNTTGYSIRLPKHPPKPKFPIELIPDLHDCKAFMRALKEYLTHLSSLPVPRHSSIPFQKIDIFHGFKFSLASLHDTDEEHDTVKASPSTLSPSTKEQSPHRYDTVVAINPASDSESTGLEGMRIGRIRVIFRLPSSIPSPISPGLVVPSNYPQQPLACVEWYSNLKGAAEPDHGMYLIKKPPLRADGTCPTSIIPLTDIRQSCQLTPSFSKNNVDSKWTTDNVLDLSSSFLVNNWGSLYGYQTIW